MNISTESNNNSILVKPCLNGEDGDTSTLNTTSSEINSMWIYKHELRRDMSVTEFAKEARITRQAVVKMITGGRLKAQKVGEQYVIDSEELVRYLQVK
jgi:excisionase family DNA binding protein